MMAVALNVSAIPLRLRASIVVAGGTRAGVSIAWAACLCAMAITSEAAPREVLTPDQIKESFVGKVITDGYHWSALIQADGNVKAVQMGRSRRGLWAIKGKEFCLALPKNSTFECWKVIRNKDGFVFNRFGQDQLDIQALPLTKNYDFN